MFGKARENSYTIPMIIEINSRFTCGELRKTVNCQNIIATNDEAYKVTTTRSHDKHSRLYLAFLNRIVDQHLLMLARK